MVFKKPNLIKLIKHLIVFICCRWDVLEHKHSTLMFMKEKNEFCYFIVKPY